MSQMEPMVKLDVTLNQSPYDSDGNYEDVLNLVYRVLPDWSAQDLKVQVRQIIHLTL